MCGGRSRTLVCVVTRAPCPTGAPSSGPDSRADAAKVTHFRPKRWLQSSGRGVRFERLNESKGFALASAAVARMESLRERGSGSVCARVCVARPAADRVSFDRAERIKGPQSGGPRLVRVYLALSLSLSLARARANYYYYYFPPPDQSGAAGGRKYLRPAGDADRFRSQSVGRARAHRIRLHWARLRGAPISAPVRACMCAGARARAPEPKSRKSPRDLAAKRKTCAQVSLSERRAQSSDFVAAASVGALVMRPLNE